MYIARVVIKLSSSRTYYNTIGGLNDKPLDYCTSQPISTFFSKNFVSRVSIISITYFAIRILCFISNILGISLKCIIEIEQISNRRLTWNEFFPNVTIFDKNILQVPTMIIDELLTKKPNKKCNPILVFRVVSSSVFFFFIE